jgi:hypothetical protein
MGFWADKSATPSFIRSKGTRGWELSVGGCKLHMHAPVAWAACKDKGTGCCRQLGGTGNINAA